MLVTKNFRNCAGMENKQLIRVQRVAANSITDLAGNVRRIQVGNYMAWPHPALMVIEHVIRYPAACRRAEALGYGMRSSPFG
jgi:hypothetical protein